MKKIFAFVFAAAACAFSAFADNALNIGSYYPVAALSFDDENVTTAGAGVSLDYTHVSDGGFTWKIGSAIAVISTEDIKTVSGEDEMGGIDFDFGAGFGYAFVNDDFLNVSLFGDIGIRGQSVIEDAQITVADNRYDVVQEVTAGLFYIGPEISVTFKFAKHFGLFANIGLFYATGSTDCKVTYELNGREISTMGTSDSYETSGLIFQPKFGVSILF